MNKILVVSLFRTDVPSLVNQIHDQLQHPGITQMWRAMTGPKFPTVNSMLRNAWDGGYDWLWLFDDDVTLPKGFVGNFLSGLKEFDFALAQPARTAESDIHHPIVCQVQGVRARRTRFVEIGPVVAIRRDLVPILTPFDESTPMGWGYDFVWPKIVDSLDLRMGIIDEVAVGHTFRRFGGYDTSKAGEQMADYLARTPHYARERCYQNIAEYRIHVK